MICVARIVDEHKDPEKTRANTDERGWQTFGDVGHLDEDGFLYLTDRASYMVISGGVNVYPPTGKLLKRLLKDEYARR